MFVETKRDGEAPVKEKPSLTGFIAWLETQNPTVEYDYCNVSVCAIGRWLHSLGLPPIGMRFHEVGLTERIVHDRPWTFGAALKRARRSLSGG